MFNSNIFDAKVIKDKEKLDGMSFVAPKSQCEGSFIVALSNEVQLKKIVGKDAGLGKTVTALVNFKVSPTVAVST